MTFPVCFCCFDFGRICFKVEATSLKSKARMSKDWLARFKITIGPPQNSSKKWRTMLTGGPFSMHAMKYHIECFVWLRHKHKKTLESDRIVLNIMYLSGAFARQERITQLQSLLGEAACSCVKYVMPRSWESETFAAANSTKTPTCFVFIVVCSILGTWFVFEKICCI